VKTVGGGGTAKTPMQCSAILEEEFLKNIPDLIFSWKNNCD